MKKLILLFLLIPTLCYGQSKSEDYWVYIKDKSEITSSDRIAGTSQKGDIVEVIPCSRSTGTPSTPGYLIVKVSGITEAERNAMLAPYTETRTVDGREVTTTLAYRLNKMDVDSFKTAQSIDSKTSVVTTALSKTAITTTQKTATDITAMQREAKLYDRLMPVRQLAKWGWEKIIPNAWAANTTHYVNTASSGGDGTTNNTSGATAAFATLNVAEDTVDGTAYSAGETATINCSGTSADTTAVTFAGWDADVTLYVNGDYAVTSGTNWSDSYYHLVTSGFFDDCLTVSINNVHVSKFQGSATGAGGANCAISNVGASNFYDKCILKSTTGYAFLGYSSSSETKLTNIIAYNSPQGYRFRSGTYKVYNCSAYDNTTGFLGLTFGANITLTNCSASNATIDYNLTAGDTWAVTYSASDDATVGAGTGNKSAQDFTNTFVNRASDDYHLASGDSILKDSGTSTSMPNDDIDGVTRSGTWDIGADEYVATGGATPRRRIIIISKHDIHPESTNNYSRLGDCLLIRRKVFA